MIGEKIRNLRLKLGLSQTGLAKKVGMTQAQLSAVEADKNLPSQEQMVSLAKVLGCDGILIDYKYTSVIFRYLQDKYFPGVEFGSHRDITNLSGLCSVVLDTITVYASVLGRWTGPKDDIYRGEVEKLRVMTSRLALMARLLDEVADDFLVG